MMYKQEFLRPLCILRVGPRTCSTEPQVPSEQVKSGLCTCISWLL